MFFLLYWPVNATKKIRLLRLTKCVVYKNTFVTSLFKK